MNVRMQVTAQLKLRVQAMVQTAMHVGGRKLKEEAPIDGHAGGNSMLYARC